MSGHGESVNIPVLLCHHNGLSWISYNLSVVRPRLVLVRSYRKQPDPKLGQEVDPDKLVCTMPYLDVETDPPFSYPFTARSLTELTDLSVRVGFSGAIPLD